MSQSPPSFSAWVRMPQTIVALSALLLSFCGLFIALYEASLVRRAQRASVWPYVEVSGSINPGSVAIRVRNSGVGPARVQNAAILYEDGALRNWKEMLRVLGVDRAPGTDYQSLIGNRVLPSDSDEELVFKITREPEHADTLDPLSQALLAGNLDIEICFCSVFDECWVTFLQDVIGRSRLDKEPVGSRPVDGCEGRPASGI